MKNQNHRFLRHKYLWQKSSVIVYSRAVTNLPPSSGDTPTIAHLISANYRRHRSGDNTSFLEKVAANLKTTDKTAIF